MSFAVQWQFLIDEDMSPRIAQLLQESGFHATCIRDRGRLEGKDWDHLKLALREDMVLCTKNPDDYVEQTRQYQADGRVHCGVLGVEEMTVEEMAQAIIDFANSHSPNDILTAVKVLGRCH